MRRMMSIAAMLMLLAVPALGQTTRQLVWNYDNKTLTDVNTWQQSASVDGVAIPGTITCTTVPTGTECAVPIIPPTDGKPHAYRVTATANGVTESTTRTIDLTQGPNGAQRIRITSTTVVEITN